MKKIVIILYCFIFILTLGACSHISAPQEFAYREIQTSFFKIASWQKISVPTADYRIYIEGDGYSFDSRGLPTTNPTPHSIMMRQAAFNDPHPNVIYLARPCQFVKDDKCEEKYWTVARFADEVINSEAEAIQSVVRQQPITVIGFSGGAQVAGLLTIKKLNILKIITIAGNLDHRLWTEYHHLPPLNESLNAADYKYLLDHIEQIHFIGGKDTVIPAQLNKKIAKNKSIITLPNASHNQGWEDAFAQIYAE